MAAIDLMLVYQVVGSCVACVLAWASRTATGTNPWIPQDTRASCVALMAL